MKVLLINGSPRREGNTFIALSEVARTLRDEGIGAEIVSIGTRAVQGCIACGKCTELGRCVFNDALYNEVREKLAGADALVVGSPVYYAGPNGSLCALLDRLFYSCGELLAYKPAAAVAVCRRGGASATFDRLNKYFTISNMPAVLEQRPRTAARRGGAGCRRIADDAGAGAQHGARASRGAAGRGGASGARRAGGDEFHPVGAADGRRLVG